MFTEISPVTETENQNNRSDRIVIQTVNCCVGGGKTQAAIRYAKRVAKSGKKIMIVQPSKLLVDETLNHFHDLIHDEAPVRVKAIYSQDKQTGSVRDIVTHIRETDGEGEVLLITHAALLRLPYVSRMSDWELILDEVPQIDWTRQFNLAEHIDEFCSLVETVPYNSTYISLCPSDRDLADSISENEYGDEIWDLHRDLTYRLSSDNWLVLTTAEGFEKFRNGEAKSLTVSGLLKPNFLMSWRSVTLMSAVLDQSLAYRYWGNDDRVAFRPHWGIKPERERHTNGRLLDIYYALDADNSKTLRSKTVDYRGSGATVEEINTIRAARLFGDDRWVFMANRDASLKYIGTGIQLPNTPHGLNSFRHIHNAAIFSALNPPPAHTTFLRDLAHIDPDELRNAGYRQAVYQAAGRISLRDPNNRSPKRVVVMDRGTALWLQAQFPGSNLKLLPDLPSHNLNAEVGLRAIGRKRIHSTNSDRTSAYRRNKLEQLLAQYRSINAEMTKCLNIRGFDTSISKIHSNDSTPGNLFLGRHHGLSSGTTMGMSESEMDQFLFEAWGNRYEDKHSNYLIGAAEFDPTLTAEEKDPERTKRGLKNISRMKDIWLDNDGDGISHGEFAALFPHIKMTIYNSYSSHNEAVRYRVYIPTEGYMTPDIHRHIISEIMYRLVRRGFYGEAYFKKYSENAERLEGKRRHGFDESKFNAASLFYLPCRSEHGEDHSFLIRYNPDGYAIDSLQWINRSTQSIKMEKEPQPHIRSPVLDDESEPIAVLNQTGRVMELRSQWRTLARERTRNSEFFAHARRLFNAGLRGHDLQQLLWADAETANDPAERRRAIPGILRKLTK